MTTSRNFSPAASGWSASRSGIPSAWTTRSKARAASPTSDENAGARYFKLKLNGDPAHDAARLTRIGKELATLPYDYSVTLDANEQYADLAALGALVDRLDRDAALKPIAAKLLYIEQPMPRDITRQSPLGALARRDFIIDEADDSYDAFPAARALGYRGISSKSCKGIYKSVINATRAAKWSAAGERYFISGEDLTCQAGLAVQQDLALGALIGVTHAERNGHHYVDGFADTPAAEAEAFLAAHPDLYVRDGGNIRLAIHDGDLLTGSLTTPGFATSVHPDWSTMPPLAAANSKNSSGASTMTTKRLGLIMNGVTGRMGLNQHLIRSIIAIRDQGGVVLANGDRMMPDPILVGRDADKVERLAKRFNVERWTTDLDKALADKNDTIFFDAATTQARPSLLTKAINAGKHVYCEKPIATNLDEAVAVLKLAERQGRQARHGAGQAVPAGPEEARLPARFRLLRPDALGARRVRLLGVRRRLAGGAAAVVELSQRGRRRHHSRHGLPLALRARQSVRRSRKRELPRHHGYSRALGREGQEVQGDRGRFRLRHLPLKGGVIAHINMSWVTRVYRDDLVTFQVDGTHGSAVAGLTDCVIQARQATPRPVWNPDEKRTHDFYADWQKLPENTVYDNGFKEQWEMFIRHVCEDAPYKYTLLEGAKGVQLAECALQSWSERRWIDVAPIKV